MKRVDVAVVGAGGAGLSLVLALQRNARRTGRRAPSVAVIDPVHRREADRTWCWWAERSDRKQWFDDLVSGDWAHLVVAGRDGDEQELDLGGYRYVMLRSPDFYRAADEALAELHAENPKTRRIERGVEQVEDGERAATLTLSDGTHLAARWVFDSRPAAVRRPGAVTLLQHFRGWAVRFDDPVLDPRRAMLMDFRVPRPAQGVAFGYCLPTDERHALIEYTEFSREQIPSPAYDLALRAYLRRRWNVAPGDGVSVEAVEDGVIPMTDAAFARRAGQRIFRLGTAGGATRPSTGYTFAAMQRQAEAVSESLLSGHDPEPPAPYPGRALWLDAVLLRALDQGYVDGADLFTGLFARNSPERVVRFLDGASSLVDDLALMRTSPLLPMSRATVGDAAARARRFLVKQSRSVVARNRS